LLGLWVSESEGVDIWLNVLIEIKNSGANDILIACRDGPRGFSEAINTVFPKTEIKLCIIQLIRNTFKYINSKDQKSFMKNMLGIYSALTEEAALIALDKLEEFWSARYSLTLKIWRNNWVHAATLFKYPEEIRKIIYTSRQMTDC